MAEATAKEKPVTVAVSKAFHQKVSDIATAERISAREVMDSLAVHLDDRLRQAVAVQKARLAALEEQLG